MTSSGCGSKLITLEHLEQITVVSPEVSATGNIPNYNTKF